MSQYELKLAGGKRVIWEGKDGIDAGYRYVGAHPDAIVIAYRPYPRTNFVVELPDVRDLGQIIIEPGSAAWLRDRSAHR